MEDETLNHKKSEFLFQQICNGSIELQIRNETDETSCPKDWPCRIQYTICDKHWDCLNGEDELNCTKISDKPFKTYGCLSSLDKVNNGVIDCLGSTDERQYCVSLYSNELERRYRCWNSTQCINIPKVCDCHKDCLPDGDDELVCPWMRCANPEEISFENIDGMLIAPA
ncbi:unnamed protein product [Didymodactylos carnosus]|uniref:Uncharacterized protein n=1 Tax=Didymodactylos carnosus TaxID=1234261 RepID=A0A815HVB4_9BILA|nr:unnamed protein product [Didymodactylos carnosus]CAF1357159.1 unnamed protein product [Didymodactylos carnosus]CAF3623587.1 unnamed protein product [Didymodactylos carnosus]CAF4231844.1 unnamed protein product [Didymodactylos carnosus]